MERNPLYGIGAHWVGPHVFKASALWADIFYKSKCPFVCVCLFVRLFTFEVLRQTIQVSLGLWMEDFATKKNIASIVKSCPEHIPQLSMCQFVFTKRCDKKIVTTKMWHKNCDKKRKKKKKSFVKIWVFRFSYNFGIVTIWVLSQFEFCHKLIFF